MVLSRKKKCLTESTFCGDLMLEQFYSCPWISRPEVTGATDVSGPKRHENEHAGEPQIQLSHESYESSCRPTIWSAVFSSSDARSIPNAFTVPSQRGHLHGSVGDFAVGPSTSPDRCSHEGHGGFSLEIPRC